MVSTYTLEISLFIPVKIINRPGRYIILIKGGVGVTIVPAAQVIAFIKRILLCLHFLSSRLLFSPINHGEDMVSSDPCDAANSQYTISQVLPI